MKKLILTLLIGSSSISIQAQQMGLSSQYMFNEQNFNPGAIGGKNYIPIQFNFRKQWLQFPGSPTSQYVTAHGAVGKNMGIGGSMYNDIAGPARKSGFTFGTAYRLRLDKNNDHKIGLGISLALGQFAINERLLETFTPNDPTIVAGFNNVMVPDANFGAFYTYKDKAFAGISAMNLVQMDRDLYKFNTILSNTLVRNYTFLGGYKFKLPKKFDIKVTTMLQMIETGTFQGEYSLLGIYNNMLWVGGSYRNSDAVVFMGGAQFGPFRFGYAYDYTLSKISSYSVGTHELFLELQLFPSKDNRSDKGSDGNIPWLKRNRIYSPGI